MSTVYVFGAGASRHVGYPLAANMGTLLFDWMRDLPNGYFIPSVEFFVSKFGESPNIEDLITQISAEGRVSQVRWRRGNG